MRGWLLLLLLMPGCASVDAPDEPSHAPAAVEADDEARFVPVTVFEDTLVVTGAGETVTAPFEVPVGATWLDIEVPESGAVAAGRLQLALVDPSDRVHMLYGGHGAFTSQNHVFAGTSFDAEPIDARQGAWRVELNADGHASFLVRITAS